MATPTVSSDDLPRKVAGRVRRCGTTILGKTAEGVEKSVCLTCKTRACEDCTRRKSQAVYNAVSDTLQTEGVDDPVLLTLSHGDLCYGYGSEALRNNLKKMSEDLNAALQLAREIVGDQQMMARWADRVAEADGGTERRKARRWFKYYRKKLLRRGGAIRPRPELDKYKREFASEFGGGGMPPMLDSLDYMWVREVTAGSDDVDRWNPHYHVLVPDVATAQLINACWQHVSAPDGYYWSTSIDEGRADDAADAAKYVSKYVSKSRAPRESYHAKAKLKGMKGARLYDAGGRWRPLGLAPDPVANPVEFLSTPTLAASGYWEPWDDFYSRGSIVRSMVKTLAVIRERFDEWGDMSPEAQRRLLEAVGCEDCKAERLAADWKRARAKMLDPDRNFSETPGGSRRDARAGEPADSPDNRTEPRGDP